MAIEIKLVFACSWALALSGVRAKAQLQAILMQYFSRVNPVQIPKFMTFSKSRRFDLWNKKIYCFNNR